MSKDESRLLELFRRFPPRVIESQEQLEATQAVVDALVRRPELDQAEEEYLSLLGALIHDWEEEHEPIPDISGPELIRVLLEERGLRQRDLVEAGIFSTETVASDVLARRRQFRLEYVVGAARFFQLPAAVFLPSRELEPA
ncbi:MAG: transcriptional regulator [Candidatus Dormibacteraeota bacterium]|nr:transcriptional regulator [Candidatus Dormibacteraeota bacterium]MDQ6920471.1 transcriptional regulator [Candidatus Dormibacteraeota bacterium]